MKLRLTLLAVAAAGLWSTAPLAQHTSNPTGMYTDSVPYGTNTMGWQSQNSDMRTRSDTVYVYPSGTTYVMPSDRGVIYQPTATRRGMSYGPTHSPNPNKAQNSDMRTQGWHDSAYYYAPGELMYYMAPSEIQSGPTHTPNPNRVQNNGVPTRY